MNVGVAGIVTITLLRVEMALVRSHALRLVRSATGCVTSGPRADALAVERRVGWAGGFPEANPAVKYTL
jgi:hypothetical protein